MQPHDLLGTLLKQVSRSFYLTLKVLPHPVRQPIGLAYLFARAADTIADAALISRAERLKHLTLFREAFRDGEVGRLRAIKDALCGADRNVSERELLSRLDEGFALLRALDPADQSLVRDLILTLTEGMVMDLATFPG